MGRHVTGKVLAPDADCAADSDHGKSTSLDQPVGEGPTDVELEAGLVDREQPLGYPTGLVLRSWRMGGELEAARSRTSVHGWWSSAPHVLQPTRGRTARVPRAYPTRISLT